MSTLSTLSTLPSSPASPASVADIEEARDHDVTASAWLRLLPALCACMFLSPAAFVLTLEASTMRSAFEAMGGFVIHMAGAVALLLRMTRATKLRIRGNLIEAWTRPWFPAPWRRVGVIERTEDLVIESRGGVTTLRNADDDVALPGWVVSDRVSSLLGRPIVMTKS